MDLYQAGGSKAIDHMPGEAGKFLRVPAKVGW